MAMKVAAEGVGEAAMAPGPVTLLDRGEAVASWTKAYGLPPPRGLSTKLLRLAAAYHAQASQEGGLRPAVRRSLPAIANDTATARKKKLQPRPQAKAPVGTRLLREWHGETHIVDVLEGGVFYKGRHFRSLSAVARRITGARWSGPRFFGL